jgi:hypothetical protein
MAKEPQEPILLTADGAIAAPPALVHAGLETLRVAIVAAGARTSERFIEFFTAKIRNRKHHGHGWHTTLEPRRRRARGPKYIVKRGKTPVLSVDQARQLLDSIDMTELS